VEKMNELQQILYKWKNPESFIDRFGWCRSAIISGFGRLSVFINKIKARIISSEDTRQLRQSILDIAVEEYRMREVFVSVLGRLNPTDIPRFENRYRYFSKEVEKAISNAGYRVVGAESFLGRPFDVGMAVKPLNIKKFDAGDELVVDQMVEPVIMQGETVARIGIVKLRRK
jgi:hypothetical protein